MRVVQKAEFIQSIRSIREREQTLCGRGSEDGIQEMMRILSELQAEAITLGNGLEALGYMDIVTELEEYCEKLYECSTVSQNVEILGGKYQELRKLSESVEAEIETIPAKLKIAFFPYKISMWDSLESIWEAASRDNRCECQLVPIPYYSKNKAGEVEEEHYEGCRFPSAALDYKTYFPEQEKPDIMYIHNPYDQYNKVTMVDSRFFSSELKKAGGILVYVPYYMSGYCVKYERMLASCGNIGAVHSDYIVVQCENLKKAYEYCGFPSHRLLVLGSPKVDAIYKIEKKTYDVIGKWHDVIQNRKVILLNTSIYTSIEEDDWLEYIREFIEPVLQDERLALIWRPHPLLRDMIRAMINEGKQYGTLLERIKNAPNAIIDDSDTAEAAIKVSDAMISDYSSMVMQYTFTGKPSYILTGKGENRKYHVFCDYFSNYFREDGCCLEKFLAMVIEGTDAMRSERLKRAKDSVINVDGTCGESVHQVLYEKALRRIE